MRSLEVSMRAHFDNLFSIKGKVALVTGGSRGIGEMIAAGFAAHGATVYISSRKADACEATAKRLRDATGAKCVALPGDQSKLADIEAIAKRLSEREEKLHILVNNVGSVDGIKTPVFDNFSYGPSKAAIHHLTRVLATHLVKQNILVNAIAPGPFPTWMLSTGVGFRGKVEGDGVDWGRVGRGNPRGRVGTPEDIA